MVSAPSRAIGLGKSLVNDRMARTSAALMLVVIGNSALGYVFWTVCARVFPASQVGTVSAIISAATLVSIISDFGVRTIVMQELPQSRGEREWSEYVSASLILTGASSGVIGIVVAIVLGRVHSDMSLFMQTFWPVVFVLLAVTSTLGNLLDGVSTAERKPGGLLGRAAVGAISKPLFLAVLLIAFRDTWQIMVLATLLSVGLSVFWGVGFQLRRLHPGWRFAVTGVASTLRRLGGQLVGHHLMNLGAQLPIYVLPLEVVAQLSSRDNAYMSLTWLVCGAFLLVSPAVSSALFVQGRWDPDQMKATVARAARLITALLLPVGILSIALGREVLGLFGHDYAEHGYSLLVILTFSAIPDAYTNVKIAIFRANSQLGKAVQLNVGMGLSSVILTWFGLPHLGIDAVGWAWLTSQTVGAMWAFVSGHVEPSRPAGRHRPQGGTGRHHRPSDRLRTPRHAPASRA